MPRAKPPTRAELVILVKQHLERAGEQGLSRSELALLIPNTSPRSIQRAVEDLRANHNAKLTCFGRLHRYRLDAALPLPLHAPDGEDLVAFIYLLGLAKPILSPAAYERIEAAVEELDARARLHHAASDIPPANVLTASYSHAARVDESRRASMRAGARRLLRPRLALDSSAEPTAMKTSRTHVRRTAKLLLERSDLRGVQLVTWSIDFAGLPR
jgi:hypothetical protein